MELETQGYICFYFLKFNMLINAKIPSTDPGSGLFFYSSTYFTEGKMNCFLVGGGEGGPYQYL